MMKRSLAKLVKGENLAEAEMVAAMGQIMEGEATPAQIGGFLTALRIKGETVEEITGATRVMRAKALQVRIDAPVVVDTCGTGGDGSNTFNISTTAAFIVSAAGVPVAKHGNRAMSSRCGSADVLEALGVKMDLAVPKIEQCLADVGMGFMFAQVFHKSMKHAAAPRREVGFRTIFNVLGPLSNPASANCQLLGVCQPELTGVLAEVLQRLGAKRAMVVHGAGGLDEFSLEGPNKVSYLADNVIHSFVISAKDVGLASAPNRSLEGSDACANALLIENILKGNEKGPKRDAVLLNAAAALMVAGCVSNIPAGICLAGQLIDNGAAFAKLEALRHFA